MNQLALFIEPKPRVRTKPKLQPISIVIKDDALIQRAQAYEMGWYERAIRKGHEREIPTLSTLPIRKGNKVIGHQTVYFPNHPDINKRNTVVRNFSKKGGA